jgi:hypothetical protein
MNETLILNLIRHWYEMIDADIKPEEYRDIKKHWIRQLIPKQFTREDFKDEAAVIELIIQNADHYQNKRIKHFDYVEFRNGYAANAPRFTRKCLGIEIRTGNAKWGAEPGKVYFVILLGEKVNRTLELQV